ncbi:MAG: CopG family transcriptional regulator [Prolixibacteraceae bacterium]|nr:CopG family transcriptional regulator [Prolixibacteraceae bacterium]
MYRTQIQLEDKQVEELKKLAQKKNRSISSLIRDAVEMILSSERKKDDGKSVVRAKSIAGRYGFGTEDLSEKHDEELTELYSK